MNKYATLSPEELEKHLSNFLISSWSQSSISDFIRNEKSFERKHIFRDYSKQKGMSAIIGDVYDKALNHFFEVYKVSKEKTGFDALMQVAHNKLDSIGANKYRAQKDKTISQLQLKALNAVNFLIKNFLSEFSVYENEIQEIIGIQNKITEFISINDIDIPLPLVTKPDLIFIDKGGFLAVLDHKSKYSYTKQADVNLRYSNQSIAYILAVNEWIKKQKDIVKKYPKAIEGVKKFFFYENKFSKNKDNSNQIRQIPIDIEKSRVLYEQVLFEGIWRVMEAVQNPDYVYLMNPNDYFEDGEEIINFWIKTHLEGLEGFPKLKPHQITLLKKKRSAIRRASLVGIPQNIIKQFSQPKKFISLTPKDMENMTIAQRIEHRLSTFGYPVKIAHVIEGYSCDTYLVDVNAGLKISKIYNYEMDIANAVGVSNVRIAKTLVNYDDAAFVSIEVKRKDLRPLFLEQSEIPGGWELPLGKDNFGKVFSWDIGNPTTPHLMIAGTSGSGKSVTILTIIETARKKGIKITILDPKYDEKFLSYKNKRGVTVMNELPEIEKFMKSKVEEMDEIFKAYGARGASENKQLIIFDEAADCFARQSRSIEYPEDFEDWGEDEQKQFEREAKRFKTLEENTLILSQKARSAGIHLVLAAQRFSVKVLSGDAKANFSTRLCLFVKSSIDSRVMLDQEGAEKLRGKGDALLSSPESSEPVRLQCFISKNF
ncbi:MAG: DNA translocase FtsK [Bacteroidota bacterium]